MIVLFNIQCSNHSRSVTSTISHGQAVRNLYPIMRPMGEVIHKVSPRRRKKAH